MSCSDPRGHRTGTASTAARDAAERALWRMMSFYDTPLADLEAAEQADPGWAMPHAMKAGFLLSLTEPSLVAQARASLHAARERERGCTPRERAHLEALTQVLEGRWATACRTWDELLVDHPRDALALQWAHLWDFYRGDAPALRGRPARALPDWDEADPLFGYVLALHAFGLEECNLYPQAEEVGRRALQANPRVPWAVHAVAHVMEMQGRFEEGATWLRRHQSVWAEGNGFATHLWWHKALFRLEVLDLAGAWRLVDNHLSGAALQISLQRLDAAALLWRLHLLGEDVSAQCRALVAAWPMDEQEAGYYAFNDLHALLALVGAGDLTRAEHWLACCAARALSHEDAVRHNRAMAREVGLPLMRGVLAWARGDAQSAATLLYGARGVAQRFGGSHAQRDLIDQTLLALAAQGGDHARAIGRALLNERRLAKPDTPLTRHWIEVLGVCAAGLRG